MALEIIRLASDVASSAQQVWDWHSRPGALRRLLPPWEPISVVERGGGLEEGSRTTLRLKYGLLEMDWISEHLAPDPGRSFGEMQVQGPFATWRHRHLFSATVGADQYREPMRLEPGEVPADLLSRLSESQRSPKTWGLSDEESDVSTRNNGVGEGTRTPGFQDHNLAL